jgi:Rieske Fe-S protein
MSHPADLSRRRFVKTFTFGAAFSMLLGKPWRGTLLAEVQPLAAGTVGILRVKLSDYPALQDDFGSVRLSVAPIQDNLPVGSFYPIIINRAPGSRFYALDSSCRHSGCVVPVYDEIEGAIVCPCHGSRYAIDGTVTAPPATSSLIKYPITFDGANTLIIQVPGLGYRVDASLVDSGTGTRMQIDFPTIGFVEYEVLFRARIRDSWTVVPFSSTVDGPADEMSLIGDDLPATVFVAVFVDPTTPAGFYSVAIKILDG